MHMLAGRATLHFDKLLTHKKAQNNEFVETSINLLYTLALYKSSKEAMLSCFFFVFFFAV